MIKLQKKYKDTHKQNIKFKQNLVMEKWNFTFYCKINRRIKCFRMFRYG